MSWHKKALVLASAILIFTGCSYVYEEPSLATVSPALEGDNTNEDYLTMVALTNQYYDQNRTKSLEIYTNLYKKNHQLAYLKEAIKLSLVENDTKTRDYLLTDGLKRFPNNKDLQKLQVNRYVADKKYKKAARVMKRVIRKEHSSENYTTLGTIYYFQKKFHSALYYFNKAYKMSSDEDTLIKIATLLDENLNNRQKAINKLENYIRFKQSASKKIYYKLLQLYSAKMNLNGLIKTYKHLYRDFGDDEYAKKVIELYMYSKKQSKAMQFLKDTGYEPNMLMDLYASNKNFKEAFKVAKKEYGKYGDVNDLGRMAIYEYERYQNKLTSKILKSVCDKFEKVLEKSDSPLYLNYYGYLLIDHDIDVDKGINYVQKALEKEPKSVYYIDSLAWGYYKKGQCKKALNELERVLDETDEKEMHEHYEVIKKCVQKGKK